MAYKLKFVIIVFLFFSISFCYSQIKLSKEFQEDIKSVCLICKDNLETFHHYYKDDFHLAHFFYQKKLIDSSFIYATRILNKEESIEPKKQYVLYYLKALMLESKSLHKASNSNFKKALSLLKEDINVKSTDYVFNTLSKNYIGQKKYDSAIVFLKKWKKNHTKTPTTKASINYHNLGIAYLHKENYKKAEENLLKSHELNSLSKNTLDLAYSSIDLANLYYEQYKDSLAIVYFKKGLEYAKRSDDLTILQNAYLNMAVIEKNRKGFQKALFYHENYTKIKDSIWNRDKIWKLAQTDKTIAAAIAKERLTTEKTKTNRIILFSSILLLLLLVVSFTLYKINKQRTLISKQKEDLEDLHALKDDLFTIIGHDLRAPMHHVLNLNTQLVTTSKQIKNTALTSLVHKSSLAATKMRFILDNILHWILLKNENGYFEIERINAERLIKLVISDFDALLEDKTIHTSVEINDDITVFADINSLKVVLRNCIDNAIKFTSKNGHIIIKGNSEKNSTTISVSDNGIGMEVNNTSTIPSRDTHGRKGTGFGLQLCQSFLKRNNGSLKIESRKNIGTTVFITLPNNKT